MSLVVHMQHVKVDMFLHDSWQEIWGVCKAIFLMPIRLVLLYRMSLHVATSLQHTRAPGMPELRAPRVVLRFRRRRLRKVASATYLGSIGREILLSSDAVPCAEWCCHWQAQFIIENTGKITVLSWVRFKLCWTTQLWHGSVQVLWMGFQGKNAGASFCTAMFL